MYFLVILICLTINYLWLKDFDRFSDSWFFRFHDFVEKQTAETAAKLTNGWWLTLLLVYGVPMLAVAGLLLLADEVFFGLLVMLVHILVLLIAFDRTQPGKLASDFLQLWKQGDQAACTEYLETVMATDTVALTENNSEELAAFFRKQLTYRSFERMFVMFFWYMVTGPLGVVFAYVTYQLRDRRTDSTPETAWRINRVLIRVLEWVPLRLLALSFSLAGNFVKCFARLQEILWDFSLQADYAELLYEFAGLALTGEELQADTSTSGGVLQQQRARIAAEIEALLALLERSQLIWLSVLALITAFGINS